MENYFEKKASSILDNWPFYLKLFSNWMTIGELGIYDAEIISLYIKIFIFKEV